jgi:thiamine kinase-like enzyme
MEISGWKISYFVDGAKSCDFEKSDKQLRIGMEYLHKLHGIKADNTVKTFDNIKEGRKLMALASATKGHIEKEFADIIEKVERLYRYIKADAERLGYGLVLCHNDTYAPNYLIGNNERIYLIDWEYAGLNYGANDIGCILCRYNWSDDQIARYLNFYVGHEMNDDEKRFYYAFIPISGFYWFCWGLYKGSVGDDDSFFFLPAYRNIIRFIDQALDSYEKSGNILVSNSQTGVKQ